MTGWTARETAAALRRREVSAVEVAEFFLDRIQRLDLQIGAFLAVSREWALQQAELAQKTIDDGSAGPLSGIPVALKDNLTTREIPTTCGSRILEGHRPVYDAHVVERLAQAGAVILGKTNLDEFAMGGSTESSAYGVTRNPWDTDRSPGGSSGGSAAAVAAGFCPVALGSDTGGSVRQPAALCGVVGFKPTYGRVSRRGLVAFASSLDQVGMFGRTVEDAAFLAEAVSGHDPGDSTSIPFEPVSLEPVPLKGVRLGFPKQLRDSAIDPDVARVVDAALASLRKEGASVVEIDLPSIELGVSTYYVIAPAEASSNLARYDGIRFGPRVDGDGHVGTVASTRGKLFGHEVKMRMILGTYVLSAGYYDAYYHRALQVRGMMAAEFEKVFQEVDWVVSPTSPRTAFRLGEFADDPLALKAMDLCTVPANLGGFPSLSLPCGASDGLPVGLLLTGPAMSDGRLLGTAHSIESALGPFPAPDLG
ncbi:MAG: Asp-tRNA(Asn)/Glu-tRNA(Gln) amidotransferase subunit GatA [Fimbriimonadaceae bacterium]|nr:Asp-tRNA(Asn)/Glu-tRNA(Gln) amidotransferase subunit GatA [Fimbriimonadaceae bacterium]QYK57948.1 MAG: Asp-tRNA(Asn)/Glu-tRNA(Gln) amidotransferase subunit GatA [Fimbriimonadaceae bacterium]